MWRRTCALTDKPHTTPHRVSAGEICQPGRNGTANAGADPSQPTAQPLLRQRASEMQRSGSIAALPNGQSIRPATAGEKSRPATAGENYRRPEPAALKRPRLWTCGLSKPQRAVVRRLDRQTRTTIAGTPGAHTLSSMGNSGKGIVSRRVFIQLGAGTGAGLLVAACSSPAPSAGTSSSAAPTSPPGASANTSATSAVVTASTPAAVATTSLGATPAPTVIGAAASGKNSAALPNYIAPNLLAKPDYDAHDPRVTLGWNNYPMNPPTSWNKPAPGTGSNVTAFAVDYYPPPTPYYGQSHLASCQQGAQRELPDDAGGWYRTTRCAWRR